MNPLTLLFRLPLLPLQGVLRLGALIQQEAQRQLADPATLRQELEEIQRRMESGQMSQEDAARAEEEAFTRFTESQEIRPAVADSDED
jgi:hypothetical protein